MTSSLSTLGSAAEAAMPVSNMLCAQASYHHETTTCGTAWCSSRVAGLVL